MRRARVTKHEFVQSDECEGTCDCARGGAARHDIARAWHALPIALDEIERLRGCLDRAVCVWCGFETSGDDKAEKVVRDERRLPNETLGLEIVCDSGQVLVVHPSAR